MGQRTQYRQRFLVSQRDSIKPVPVEEIAYFYSENKVTRLVRTDGVWFAIGETLEEVGEQVDPRRFFRANRQVLVRIESVVTVHKYFNGKLKLTLNPVLSGEVVVSRERADSFRAWLSGSV